MEASIQSLIIYLIGAAVVGLVGFVVALWRSHHALELKCSQEYLRHDAIEELKGEFRALRDLTYRIAIKMEVPVFTDGHR